MKMYVTYQNLWDVDGKEEQSAKVIKEETSLETRFSKAEENKYQKNSTCNSFLNCFVLNCQSAILN